LTRAAGSGVGVLILLCLLCHSADAQMLHLDPIPYTTPADSTSRLALVVDVDRFDEAKFGWSLNRILLTAVLPAGEVGTFFLRLSHLTFNTGDISVSNRWPWVLGEVHREAQDGWPNETRLNGFGKIELGVTGPAVLPLIRGVDYGLALGLPTGSDRLYPFSAQSIPFRIGLRKPIVIGAGFQAGVSAGYLIHADSGGEDWDATAFPSGHNFGASLARYGRRGSRWQLTWDLRNDSGRRSQLVGAQGWVPWTDDGSVGLKISREIQGSLDRPAEWYFTISFRFDSPKYRPGNEIKPTLVD
jgi:hypothetical protein